MSQSIPPMPFISSPQVKTMNNVSKLYYLIKFKDMPRTQQTLHHITQVYDDIKKHISNPYVLKNIVELPYEQTHQESAYNLEQYESSHIIVDVNVDDRGLFIIVKGTNGDNFNMIDANQLVRFYHPNTHSKGGARLAKIAVGYKDIDPIQFIRD